jgi:hypothetical protein
MTKKTKQRKQPTRLADFSKAELARRKDVLPPVIHDARGENLGRDVRLEVGDEVHVEARRERLFGRVYDWSAGLVGLGRGRGYLLTDWGALKEAGCGGR